MILSDQMSALTSLLFATDACFEIDICGRFLELHYMEIISGTLQRVDKDKTLHDEILIIACNIRFKWK